MMFSVPVSPSVEMLIQYHWTSFWPGSLSSQPGTVFCVLLSVVILPWWNGWCLTICYQIWLCWGLSIGDKPRHVAQYCHMGYSRWTSLWVYTVFPGNSYKDWLTNYNSLLCFPHLISLIISCASVETAAYKVSRFQMCRVSREET